MYYIINMYIFKVSIKICEVMPFDGNVKFEFILATFQKCSI